MKVLYVAAWGRSGTTIIDNILNAYPHIFSAGELHYLWERGLLQRRWCGCGQTISACELWTRILDRAYGADPPDPREMVALQQRLTRVRHTPKLALGRLSADALHYADLMTRLYRAIGEVTGARVIVDSSKMPSNAAILARASDLEAYLLHVIRDPRAVAHSWMRPTRHRDRDAPPLMKQHKPTKSSLYWLAWNGLTELISGAYPDRYRRMRYEDFIADPRGQITALLEFIGAPSQRGPFHDDRTVELATNHTVSGNPGRFRTGTVVIRPDDAWLREQLPGTRRATTAISAPLLHRYGYSLRPARRSHKDIDDTPGREHPRE